MDTIAPLIDMDAEIDLGNTLYYALQDNGSGLWINRTVIEDEDEKYKKVVWLEEISGYKVESDILWDGKFKDGTTAPVGEYFITLKIADQAGNETFRTAIVNVNPFSYILPITPFTPPTTNTELPSNELTSNEQEESFGNENNGNPSNETTSTNVGGEIVFANTIAQAGTLTSFTSGNENTSTPITNTEILWGAMATAVLGATLAEWQRKREEEEARQREADRIAQMEKNAERKAEKARLEYLNNAYQAKLDREKEKQNAIASARWNGIAQIEQAKEKAKQIASQNTFNHLMNEHKDQKSVYVSKVNAGGAKPLASPVRQEPEPPQSSWWDLLNPFWYFSDEPWPWETPSNTTIPSPIPNIVPSTTFTPTITILPSATSTPGQPKIYAINGPMTLDQIPQEFRCTLPEKKIINGQELYSDYYYRCKLGEKLMVGLLTDPNGWWWQDGQTTRWDTGETTEWKSIKNNSDVWNLALALGLDAEGTDHRKQDSRFNELIEQAIFNKFWHFDHGVYSTYGNGVQDPDAGMPLGTNGRLVALGSLESLQKRVTGEDGFVTLNVHASYVIRPPYDGDSTNMWEDAWNYFENNGEPTWIEPPATAPYEIGNINLDHPYYKSENVEEGMGKFEVLYRSSPNAASVRAIILTFEQFTDVYSQLPK